ncbi:2OG-Fe(II) oxygenase family protein, partial [Xenorhabdus bovienii]|uniref:2OG-Fe(II) oxygenase family protein n=1 Tax=Xenorhabdus bovienii TaxID=40576 RepID=UPI003DA6269D
FHTRSDQIEQFLLERRFWQKVYPNAITNTGINLIRLSTIILRSILELTDIPIKDWFTATGGCVDSQGTYHLTFNHYRPYFQGIGLSSHKDDGFLTILRSNFPGLEVNINNRWESVSPLEDHFIINFGLSMELLTKNTIQPVNAIMHRVSHQSKDRHTFGHFTSSYCNPEKDAGIYSYSSKQGLFKICNSRELINFNDEEIYEGTYPPDGENL